MEKPAYPQEVLREGIVNALIHRDYLLSSTDVELGVYSDWKSFHQAGCPMGLRQHGCAQERGRTGIRP